MVQNGGNRPEHDPAGSSFDMARCRARRRTIWNQGRKGTSKTARITGARIHAITGLATLCSADIFKAAALRAAVMVQHLGHVAWGRDILADVRGIACPAQRECAQQSQDQAEPSPNQNRVPPPSADHDTLYDAYGYFPHAECHRRVPFIIREAHVPSCLAAAGRAP